MNRSVASVIAGNEVTGAPGGWLRSVNPAQVSEVVAEVALGDAKTFAEAARAARAAHRSWSDVPAPVRGRAIANLGRLVEANAGMVSINNSTSGAEAHLPFGGNGKSGNGSRQSGVWVLDQFTRWQSMNWDYSGSLQKAQLDVAELTADTSFRLGD